MAKTLQVVKRVQVGMLTQVIYAVDEDGDMYKRIQDMGRVGKLELCKKVD